VFSVNGGRAEYRPAPLKYLTTETGQWEFYGTTAIPQVGSARAELIAVLPNLTADFCTAINRELGLSTAPNDNTTGTTPDCVQGAASHRFGPTTNFIDPPNQLDATTYGKLPMTRACVTCGSNRHYYHVLMAR
jgi:hypothetical protein